MDDVLLGGEVLIEFTQSGNSVRVTAIDPVSYIEASIVGPVWAGEETLRRNAIRKLVYVIRKQTQQSNGGPIGSRQQTRTAYSR